MFNYLINLKIEQHNYQKQYDKSINNNNSSLAEWRLERQSIQYFLKEQDNKYIYVITGDIRKGCNVWNSVLRQEIIMLSKGRNLFVNYKLPGS